jgi:hypothetical protein
VPTDRARIPLPAWAKRLLAAASLGVGALVVGRIVTREVPRDVEVRVRLGAYREPPALARALSVVFLREGAPVRTVSARFDGVPPVEYRRTLSLPAGDYRAVVGVEMDGRAVSRESDVHLDPSTPAYVPAPVAP